MEGTLIREGEKIAHPEVRYSSRHSGTRNVWKNEERTKELGTVCCRKVVPSFCGQKVEQKWFSPHLIL